MKNRILNSKNSAETIKKLANIVSLNSLISSDKVIVYQFDESAGRIKRMPSPEGIPSDNNVLNYKLKEGNEIFDKLLEIEEDI